jgi:sugar/nucleoside kinase (ribokinase family)
MNKNPSSLLVVGSVAFDSIKTPFGKTDKALGGSASYFSLAASKFCRPSIVAVVGEDFGKKQEKIFTDKNIDVSGIEHLPGKSFAWGGEYSFDLNNRTTLFTHLNVFENFQPKLSTDHKKSDYVFLGNTHPKLQLEVLLQISKPKFVGLDTMNYWIEKAPGDLKKVLKKVDCLIINDSEAREFSGEYNLVKAANKILKNVGAALARPQPGDERPASPKLQRGEPRPAPTLIIKRGEYGLLMFHGKNIFHLPGFPLESVIDPTGAGDSFAGGFMGFLAKTDNLSFENLKRACVHGSVMASFCCEKLGTEQLQKIRYGAITNRYKKFKQLTHFGLP